MEQTQLMARLEAAKRRAKLGQDQIDRQRMVVATLFASGEEITEAENRLRVYEKLHERYLVDVERILIALNTMPADWTGYGDRSAVPVQPKARRHRAGYGARSAVPAQSKRGATGPATA
jgi:multidrug resistance efflux pump